jgi:hypothetical protein
MKARQRGARLWSTPIRDGGSAKRKISTILADALRQYWEWCVREMRVERPLHLGSEVWIDTVFEKANATVIVIRFLL